MIFFYSFLSIVPLYIYMYWILIVLFFCKMLTISFLTYLFKYQYDCIYFLILLTKKELKNCLPFHFLFFNIFCCYWLLLMFHAISFAAFVFEWKTHFFNLVRLLFYHSFIFFILLYCCCLFIQMFVLYVNL